MTDKKTNARAESADVTSEELLQITEGISQAVDSMVRDFRFSMNVMDQIASLMHESPPNLEMVRILLGKFFNVNVSDPDEEDPDLMILTS